MEKADVKEALKKVEVEIATNQGKVSQIWLKRNFINLVLVKAAIEKVEKEIEAIMAHLATSNDPEIRQQLREEKSQLRNKESQLREEKNKLRDKEILFVRQLGKHHRCCFKCSNLKN